MMFWVFLFFPSAASSERLDVESSKLTASDAAVFDRFGRAVAISCNLVVVGAYGDDDGGISSGSAYVFRSTDGVSWDQTQKLRASDAEAGNFFGNAVAISGNLVVVGAFDRSSAYVFRTTDNGLTWNQTQRLRAEVDYFGEAVAISDNLVVVGTTRGGNFSGAAYAFRTTDDGVSWDQTQKLTASDADMFDNFGRAVAVSRKYIVVGSWADGDGGSHSGSAYVFRTRDDGVSWEQTQKLTASDAGDWKYFGRSVGISGNLVVVGSWADDDAAGSESGSAYVFRTEDGVSWEQTQKLRASDAAKGDRFGIAVAISGNSVVAGAYLDGGGSAYVFQTTDGVSWEQTQKLTASDAAAYDYFGEAVGISGNFIVVGAYGNDDGGSSSGSAYVFATLASRSSSGGGKRSNTIVIATSVAAICIALVLFVGWPLALLLRTRVRDSSRPRVEAVRAVEAFVAVATGS